MEEGAKSGYFAGLPCPKREDTVIATMESHWRQASIYNPEDVFGRVVVVGSMFYADLKAVKSGMGHTLHENPVVGFAQTVIRKIVSSDSAPRKEAQLQMTLSAVLSDRKRNNMRAL